MARAIRIRVVADNLPAAIDSCRLRRRVRERYRNVRNISGRIPHEGIIRAGVGIEVADDDSALIDSLWLGSHVQRYCPEVELTIRSTQETAIKSFVKHSTCDLPSRVDQQRPVHGVSTTKIEIADSAQDDRILNLELSFGPELIRA